jgi:nicotinate-nucleotide adenylyltransferase
MNAPEANNRPLRVGIFGGAFDPPHRAHRVLVESAIEQLELDRCVVLPTGDAWHKPRNLSPARDRLAMTRHAFADLMEVRVDDQEIRRQGPSYTVDTVERLRHEHPGATLFLLLGIDQWRVFPTWHRWDTLLDWVVPVVALRPEEPPPWPERVKSREPKDLDPRLPKPVWLLMPYLNVSSTDMRQAIATLGVGSPALEHELHPAVAGYISAHSLYSPTDPA